MRISARNIHKGTIVDVKKGQTTAHVLIDVGGAVVTASITNESVDELADLTRHRLVIGECGTGRIFDVVVDRRAEELGGLTSRVHARQATFRWFGRRRRFELVAAADDLLERERAWERARIEDDDFVALFG